MSDEFFDTIFLWRGFILRGGKGDIKVGARTVCILDINPKALYIPPMTFGTPSPPPRRRGLFPPGSGHLFSAYEL